MSYVISERQSALRKVARYNEAWTVSQTLAEFMRLEHRLASLGVGGVDVDLDDVRLRLDIMFGRLDILEEGSLREFIGSDPSHVTVLTNLRKTLEFVDGQMQREPLDIRPSLKRLAELDGPMTALASAAAAFGAARVQSDQQELENLHVIYTSLAGGLIFCGILLVFLLLHHNGLLARAHSDMQDLTTDLQKTTSKLQAQNSKLDFIAHHDALTQLPNRIRFRDQINEAFSKELISTRKGAVLLLDLDGFKDVNDTHGHDIGDALLKLVADRLQRAMQPDHLVCRLGGDEFAIVLPEADPVSAEALANKLLELVAAPYTIADKVVSVGTSIGISFFAESSAPEELFKHADFALYRAKSLGRARACLFHAELHTRFQEAKTFEADLRDAIRNDQLEVYYQPQVNTVSRATEGYEALLRWHHPDRGAISPTQFIPVAEQTGLIHELGEWILRKACLEAASWQTPHMVAVNLSPLQFKTGNLLQVIASSLLESGLDASRLELEITESALLDADDRTSYLLSSIKSLGIKIALDDFGTGYSSLGNLRRFPFDKIKIDKSFISDLSEKGEALSIVGLIIGVANSLQMSTIAEGIETEDDCMLLSALGCKQLQGYLFGRPAPAAMFAGLHYRADSDEERSA